jgi:hypothetical protein
MTNEASKRAEELYEAGMKQFGAYADPRQPARTGIQDARIGR